MGTNNVLDYLLSPGIDDAAFLIILLLRLMRIGFASALNNIVVRRAALARILV
jgi:hypothetical protein